MRLLFFVSFFQFQAVVLSQSVAHDHTGTNPFISATLLTAITYESETIFPSSTSSYQLGFDPTRKSTFSNALTNFLTKIFSDQQVYDLRILSVHIFDDHILHHGLTKQTDVFTRFTRDQNESKAVVFPIVISAEHTNRSVKATITNEDFSKMLVHVCHKFQSHLNEFMHDTGDPFFEMMESITVTDVRRMKDVIKTNSQYLVMGLPRDQSNLVSSIAIVLGGILVIVISIFSYKFYRQANVLRTDNRQETNEFGSLKTASTKSLKTAGGVGLEHFELYPDDCEFPVETHNRHSDRFSFSENKWKDHFDQVPNCHVSSAIWPESSPPGKHISYTDELQYLPKQHIFVPPGKIGVAIDVLNGQPTVRKVQKGSPLEKLLHPKDIILAIDDRSTSCLSAADMTNMMTERIDRVRKITFVRRRCCDAITF